MQRELRSAKTGWNIELLGLNLTNYASFNSLATTGRNIPWLQDRMEIAAWQKWSVIYRDVRILDPLNRLVGVYNLTTHNLLIPANYQALKKMLLDAAVVVDADKDGLPDVWEEKYFSTLTLGAGDDPDGDGASNLDEWAHGTDPLNTISKPSMLLRVEKNGAVTSLVAAFRRPAASLSAVALDVSDNLQAWSPGPPSPVLTGPDVNLFDGTGSFTTSILLDRASGETASRFFRIRIEKAP